jgi:hypothetical protein
MFSSELLVLVFFDTCSALSDPGVKNDPVAHARSSARSVCGPPLRGANAADERDGGRDPDRREHGSRDVRMTVQQRARDCSVE